MIENGHRISETMEAFYSTNFATHGQGAEYVLSVFPMVYHDTLRQLKGKFHLSELLTIIDVLNHISLSPNVAGLQLYDNLGYVYDTENIEGKYGIRWQEFGNKIDELTWTEVMCLEVWVQAYWINHEKVNLSEWVKELC